MERRLDLPPELEADWLRQQGEEFSKTDGNAKVSVLFHVLRFCFNQQIPVPEWAADAFFSATNEWYGQACSLDEAFGSVPTTQKRRAQQLLRRRTYFLVKNAMDEWNKRGRPVPVDEQFRLLEKRLGLGTTVLQEMHYGPRKRGSRQISRKRGNTR